MAAAKEAQVFRRFYDKMLNCMKDSRSSLIATAAELYAKNLISEVSNYIAFMGYEYLIYIDVNET